MFSQNNQSQSLMGKVNPGLAAYLARKKAGIATVKPTKGGIVDLNPPKKTTTTKQPKR